MVENRSTVTGILRDWKRGDPSSAGKLVEMIYDELHGLAARSLRGERAGHTLQPTALINEVYLRLASHAPPECLDRAHFFAIAAQTLRRILIDYARNRRAGRRGGRLGRVPLEFARVCTEWNVEELLAINEALDQLQKADSRAASVVEMRFFAGLEEREIAKVLGFSEITIKRDWKFARAWLLARLG